MSNPKISVCIITYNHSEYILDCLKSIAAQKCNHEYDVVICDDDSQDDTIIKVNNFIKSDHKKFNLYRSNKNIGMMANLYKALNLCRGEYIALCEGDDYWINNNKLQKQINVMENNPKCSIIVHPCLMHKRKNNNSKLALKKGSEIKTFSAADILSMVGQFAPTSSYMFKKAVVEQIPNWFCNAPLGDFLIEMYSMKIGYGIYMPDTMSAYRIFSSGSWSDNFRKDNGNNIINFHKLMLRCVYKIELDPFFTHYDFSKKKSSNLTGIAIGYLLNRQYSLFKRYIEKSYLLYHNSSNTQKYIYFLKNIPTIALFAFKLKRFIYNFFKIK